MLFFRESIEEHEEQTLAPYACKSKNSLGRFFDEEADPFRTCFQRDRDRIIHTKAFRRLKGKTQVFVSHHGDHFRSRLTHTMEVAQISRDMARTFGLNEDLAESIALAHDLGHTPFGHAGEEAMNICMEQFGERFEHNKQSVRIVTKLETRSDDFLGLNLSKEVLEGMGKHDTPYDSPESEIGALPSLEAQVVNLADEIAYINHDIDDGLRSGILKKEDMNHIELWKEAIANTPKIQDFDTWLARTKGMLINMMVTDVYTESEKNIQKYKIEKFEDVKQSKKKIISFSADFFKKKEELRIFLFQKFYRMPSVMTMSEKGQKIITELFAFFLKNPSHIPEDYHIKSKGKELRYIVCDYIAGMTDNFAEEAYKKLSHS